jgi:uncharacterized protein (TIGR00661 family)
MKILYGIQGTGNGHITRSSKIIHRLKNLGCDVDILISGEFHQIDISHDIKFNFKGFNFKHNSDGSINKIKTFFDNNLFKFIKDTKIDLSEYDKIITDFEPITSWAAKFQDKEIWGIGNQYSFLSKNTPRPKSRSFIGEFVLKHMSPVTNPIGLHFEPYDNFINYPIIRDDVMIISKCDNGHYTVYLPNFRLSEILKKLNEYPKVNFHIFSNEVKSSLIYRNCKINPLNKDKFLLSFTSSHGVITTGGFQTTSEALWCGKKLLVIPIIGQYEQLCNVESLNNLGIMSGTLDTIPGFLISKNKINKNWEDPTNKIIKKVLS